MSTEPKKKKKKKNQGETMVNKKNYSVIRREKHKMHTKMLNTTS